jgi:beta-fructofuranosidase
MRGVDDLEAGWAGAHSVPYVLSLSGDVLVATPHPDLDAYRGPASSDGQVAGAAADIQWAGTGVLEGSRGGSALFSIDGSGETLVLTVGGERWKIPRAASEVRVIVDANVLEVVTDRGVIGVAVHAPTGAIVVAGSGAEVYPLVRSGPR